MKALVSGASGFLGHAVCAELRERDHEVAALVRRPGSEPRGTSAVQGDLADAAALARVVEGVRPDWVIHLAAEIASQRDASKIAEVNVEGSRRLLAACAGGGRPRFVFASTVVTGDAGGAQLEEGSPLTVETAYGRSKQEGERLVRGSGLDNVIIRPSHVYGPGGWYEQEFVKRLKQPGRLAVIGSGQNWWDVVHVEDVARAFVDAAERAPSGALYHVVDDEPIRYYDFVALTAQALGVGGPRRIPAWLARAVAGADPVRAVVRSARSSNARIKRELGWQPALPLGSRGRAGRGRAAERGLRAATLAAATLVASAQRAAGRLRLSRVAAPDPGGAFSATVLDCVRYSGGDAIPRTALPFRGGCRTKPSRNSRGALAEVHASAVVRDDLATDRLRATDEMAVFGAHP